MRRAPKGGYDFPLKRDYRRRVWAQIRRLLKEMGYPIAESHALLMPSLEGDEIEVALNAGFRECHLHIVDKNPAIVATLKRRYPKISTYGVTASAALRRISASGIKLRAANLDFCYKLGESFKNELWMCSLAGNINCAWNADLTAYGRNSPHGAFAPECVVAVNMLRGREERTETGHWKTKPITDELLREERRRTMARSVNAVSILEREYAAVESLRENDRWRLRVVMDILSLQSDDRDLKRYQPATSLAKAEFYRSANGQTWLWSVWTLQSAPMVMARTVCLCVVGAITPSRAASEFRRVFLDESGRAATQDGIRIWREMVPLVRQELYLRGQRLTEEQIAGYMDAVLIQSSAA